MLNFPISDDKTVWATTILIFLGLLIDTEHQFIGEPVDKIQQAKALIEEMLSARLRKTMVKKIQKLTGFLNFLCRAVVPGRTFLQRMYYYTTQEMKAYHHVNLNAEMRADLEMWLKFLNEPTVYCRPFLDFTKIITADKLDWYTDASGRVGFGGICGRKYFQGRWTNRFLRQYNPSIEYLELYAVAVSALLWVRNFKNRRIAIFVDNESVERKLNNASTNCKNCLILIRKIILECMTWNVCLFAFHVESAKNNFADALSGRQKGR